jgi:hypothetical protein
MSPLEEFVQALDEIRLRFSAEKLLQEYLASEPSESDYEEALSAFAAWLHAEHTAS